MDQRQSVNNLKYEMSKTYPQTIKRQNQTPIDNVISSSPPSKYTTIKKLILVFVISIIASLIFSSTFYTWTDSMFVNTFNLNFFDINGNPKIPIIGFHTLLLCVIIYGILSL